MKSATEMMLFNLLNATNSFENVLFFSSGMNNKYEWRQSVVNEIYRLNNEM